MDNLGLGDDLPSNSVHTVNVQKVDDLSSKYSYCIIESQSQGGVTTTCIQNDAAMNMEVAAKAEELPSSYDGVSPTASIDQFLSRQVRIHNSNWDVGSSYAINIKPWELFLHNPAVVRKLDNYHLIKGDLTITIYINGTPFHAGMMLAAYGYMNPVNELFTFGGTSHLITRSQRPHLYLNASTNTGGCMCVPFFYPDNFINLQSTLQGTNFDSNKLGNLTIDSIAPLAQLSGGTDIVTVTIFAHMTNVKLSAPTTRVAAFSGNPTDFTQFDIESQADEYSAKGPVSSIAAAVASAAGKLAVIPFITPFALATQLGANAIGGIASLFGYSKPTQIANIMPMRNYPTSSLSLVEGADTAQKLTATAKQELSIDPRTVALDPTDELTLDFFTKKESFLTLVTWDPSIAISESIFSCDVSPNLESREALATDVRVLPTALSFASRFFESWAGDLVFRFQVIGTQFHKGRIAIVYDPVGSISGVDPFNTTYNTIIDLSQGRDFSISFPWQQHTPYKTCNWTSTTDGFTHGTPSLIVQASPWANGRFYMVVVNDLVTPDSVTPVQFIVSIKAGDDFELANPSGANYRTAHNIAYSGPCGDVFGDFIECQAAEEDLIENLPENNNTVPILSAISTPNLKPLIFYGEKITSFRQLMKRYSYMRPLSVASTQTPPVNSITTTHLTAFPLMPGGGGPDVSVLGNVTYNGSSPLQLFSRAFAGWRGSIRYKFLSNVTLASQAVYRDSADVFRSLNTTYDMNITDISDAQTQSARAYNSLNKLFPQGGIAVTQNRSMDSLEVEVPYSLPIRFSETQRGSSLTTSNTKTNNYPYGDSFTYVENTAVAQRGSTHVYYAAGDDFTFFGFVGCPKFHTFIPPVPV